MTKFYLNKRDAKISGVCAGIADSTGWDVTIVRIATVLFTVLVSGLPIIGYIATAWIAEPRPFGG
jgi:phage shock protein C